VQFCMGLRIDRLSVASLAGSNCWIERDRSRIDEFGTIDDWIESELADKHLSFEY